MGPGWEKVPNWECLLGHRQQGPFLSVCVEYIQNGWKKWCVAPTRKKLMKLVDFGEPTSFLDHVYLGCTQGECKPKLILTSTENVRITHFCWSNMNFSLFACSHFSNFLSDPTRKQSAMSKRGQEVTSSEGSPRAKPKPMNSAMAQSRPMNLLLHNLLSARKNPLQDLNNPVNPVNVQKEQAGAPNTRKLMRTDPSRDPIEFSQVRRQENTQHADSWKQEDRVESSSSTSTRKLVREGEHKEGVS